MDVANTTEWNWLWRCFVRLPFCRYSSARDMRFALASQCHPHASVDAIRAISRCVGLGHRVSFEIVKPNHSAAILSHGDLLLSCVPFSFPHGDLLLSCVPFSFPTIAGRSQNCSSATGRYTLHKFQSCVDFIDRMDFVKSIEVLSTQIASDSWFLKKRKELGRLICQRCEFY